MSSIVTITLNPCIDESSSVDRLISDRKLRCASPRFEPGGGGINVARAVRRLGGEALAIYPAGGSAGNLLRVLLEAEGVPQLPIPIAGWTRENFNVREESAGHQYRFVLPGPPLSVDEQESCFDAVSEREPFPSYLVASGSLPPGMPPAFLARLARTTRQRGGRFVLDASGPAAEHALEEGVFLFKPSLREFLDLTRTVGADDAELADAAMRLIRLGRCEAVVLSLGAAGALVVTRSLQERVAAPTVPVRSTVGAGDAMLAEIVLSLQRGRPMREAVRFGVAAGTATVTRPGTELCELADVEPLFGRMAETAGSEEPAFEGGWR